MLLEKRMDLPIPTIRDDTRSPASLHWGRCADKLEEYTAVLGNRASFIVLTDSVGNEPEDETAKFYVLKKVKKCDL